MPDSPPLLPQSAAFPPQPLTMGVSPQSAQLDPSLNPLVSVFCGVAQATFDEVSPWAAFANVREHVIQFLHQTINILGPESLRFVDTYVIAMMQTTTMVEFPKVLRVIMQAVNKTRSRLAQLMGEKVLPMVVEHVLASASIDSINPVLGVVSEVTREQREIVRQFFALIHAISHSGCIQCFCVEPTQSLFPSILDMLIKGYCTNTDTELAKLSLQSIARLAVAWATPQSDFERFLLERVVPALMEAFTGPAYDLKDAKTFLIVSEGLQLLKSLTAKLGEGAVESLYGVLTTPMSVSVGSLGGMATGSLFLPDEAQDLCTRLCDPDPKIGMQFKVAFRNLLEAAQQRRMTASSSFSVDTAT